ncbi:MAG: tetratricopeptide repeat protein [Thermoplasmata archaeon]|nr:MAG: tetratricopeptide repeat protein [Thermoplasmata archaeon]
MNRTELMAEGMSLVERGKYKEAVEIFNEILTEDPQDVEAWINKGCALLYLEKPRESLHCTNKALEIDLNNTIALNNKGIALFRINDFEGAEDAFNKTLEIDPKYAEAWYNKACLASEQKKVYEALRNLEKALSLDRNRFLTHAKIDRHLDNIRNEARFKELVD